MSTERTPDFYRVLAVAAWVKIMNSPDVPREKAVRFYCTQFRQAWALQVRAPLELRSGREGKDFLIAHAVLTRDELVALRDSIDAHLRDGEEFEEAEIIETRRRDLATEDERERGTRTKTKTAK